MDRRGFLKRILGVAAFVVATEVGLGTVAEEIAVAPTVEISAPRGIQYIIAESGTYFNISRPAYNKLSNSQEQDTVKSGKSQ